MKTKIQFKPVIPLGILMMVLTLSCEELMDTVGTDTDIREKIEGQWRCDETSEYYKSTAEIFSVYIYPHPDDSSKVLIDNFYELGYDVSVVAALSNRSLYINSQTVEGGFTIIGSGTISSNYNVIEWNYSVDDGSGMIDNVVATFTKL